MHSSELKDNRLAETWSSSGEGSNLRRIDLCITNSRLESNKEEKEADGRPPRKVDVGLPEKRNSNSHGTGPVHLNHLDD